LEQPHQLLLRQVLEPRRIRTDHLVCQVLLRPLPFEDPLLDRALRDEPVDGDVLLQAAMRPGARAGEGGLDVGLRSTTSMTQ